MAREVWTSSVWGKSFGWETWGSAGTRKKANLMPFTTLRRNSTNDLTPCDQSPLKKRGKSDTARVDGNGEKVQRKSASMAKNDIQAQRRRGGRVILRQLRCATGKKPFPSPLVGGD